MLLYFDLLNEKPGEVVRQFSDDAYANLKKVKWTAKVDAATTARYGSVITVALDPNKIHVFDKETELAILIADCKTPPPSSVRNELNDLSHTSEKR